MYQKIKELLSQNYKITQISRTLETSRKTIYSYLSKSEIELLEELDRKKAKPSKLSPYEDFIRKKIEECRDASAAQIHDWMKEYYPEVQVAERTVYDFVSKVRKKYNLPKKTEKRDYTKVPELPEGKQVQADFGETFLKDGSGKYVKVYFLTMVLSRSRYKFLYLQTTPFTTSSTIEAHEKGFAFFRGIPEEMVYDQDKVLIANENLGQILYTKAFGRYKQEKGFNVYLCRKKDPESKGKVEAVVKYIKQNFLKHRTFDNIELLNQQAMEWLARTGNYKKHGTTKKSPTQEYELEKAFLKPFTEPYKIENTYRQYGIRKDNTISYKGNFYSLPEGTHRNGDGNVWITEEEGFLIIRDHEKEIAKHRILIGKGLTIANPTHHRDRSKDVADLMVEAACIFPDQDKALQYLEQSIENKRYTKDQLRYLLKFTASYSGEALAKALDYCICQGIYSIPDFKEVLNKFFGGKAKVQEKASEITFLNVDLAMYNMRPERSNINLYEGLINEN